MAVRFIPGRAGKGKTHYIFEEIKKKLDEGGNERLVLLVPEQFTLQAERDLLERLHLPGMINLEVLSINRLGQRVLETAGGRTGTLINEQGRVMVLKRIIDEKEKELRIFRRTCRQPGFVLKTAELIAELKQQDIAPAMLTAGKIDGDSTLGQKLHDIGLLYAGLNDFMQDRYIDIGDRLNLVIKKLRESSYLQGAMVWIDGFTTFSSQSLRIIEQVILQAAETSISVTVDPAPNDCDRELFELSEYTYKQLLTLAARNSIPITKIVTDGEAAERTKKPVLVHLERELYSYPYTTAKADDGSIAIFYARNMKSEIENLAAGIIGLVRDQNYRYRDIAVVCNNLDVYAPLIKRAFNRYAIPFFMDEKRQVVNHPVVELILSALELARGRYRYDDMFRYLKTGLTGISPGEVEELENYALRYGIKGYKWKEAFVRGDEEILDVLNSLRFKIMQPLLVLEQGGGRAANAREISRELLSFLEELDIPAKLEMWTERLGQGNYLEQQQETAQIWGLLTGLIQQIIEFLGDRKMNLREYRQVLENGLQSIELGIIPTTIDQVLVGNIQRSKSHDIKALFVIGVNDGILPSGKKQEGILNEDERECLQEMGVEIGLIPALKLCEENFLIYSALSKPSDYLRLSCALSDTESKGLRPSLIIDRIKQLYSDIRITHDLLENRENDLKMICTPESTFGLMVEKIRKHLNGREVDEIWWDVYSWYRDREEWQDRKEAVLKGIMHSNQPELLGRDIAGQVYGHKLKASVSRLEQYVSCPFSHFVKYALRPDERKEYQVDTPDIGLVFHNSLEGFSRRLEEKGLDWREIGHDTCDDLMEQVMDEQFILQGEGVFSSSPRYRYMSQRLKRICKRAAWTLTTQLQKGNFEFAGHELKFGSEKDCVFPALIVELPDGDQLYLKGRIDRVDCLKTDDSDYVKIIDYKSGNRVLRLSDIYYGLNLQLMVYMSAVLKGLQEINGREAKPAGVLYFRIDDPIVEASVVERNSDEEELRAAVEDAINSKLKMKGLVLADLDIVRNIDRDIGSTSRIIPVGLKNDGGFYANSSVMDEDHFQKLLQYTRELTAEIGKEIMAGNVGIEPYRQGMISACLYCPYRSLCQFDPLLDDNKFRNIKQLKDKEVMQKITDQVEGGGIDG